MPSNDSSDAPREMVRGLGVVQATALNVANMVGVGPFLTIPTFILAMQGPHAVIAWIIAAVLVICDGLVWSELGAALPGSGGTYHFLRAIYGRYSWGRILPFLFIWQFLVSGTLELASGYIGVLRYLEYIFPGLDANLLASSVPGGGKSLIALVALAIAISLCRRVTVLGWVSVGLCSISLLTVLTIIVCGALNFDGSLLAFSSDAPRPADYPLGGLGAAMLIAIYDYLGYYNVCHLGDEVKRPEKTIPRAVITSVLLVALLYLSMNISVMGVVPWQEAMRSNDIGALFMEKLYGREVAVGFSWLIIITALSCVFVMTLGYSRIPFAAARNGDFFPVFARLHPTGKYPWVSLLAVGGLTAFFCYFPFEKVLATAVTVRIIVQFIGQIVALHILRTTRPDVPLPFRMFLYPLPSLLALVGWVFVFGSSTLEVLQWSGYVLVSGVLVFGVWQGISRPGPSSHPR